MNGMNNQPTAEQLLERHFNLKMELDALQKRVIRCKEDMVTVEEVLSAHKIELGATQRLLQRQAEDKKAADEKAKNEPVAEKEG